jgi:hypothetical protein
MTSLPSISQVAGAQLGVYENLWRQVDSARKGRIDGAAAANYLKKSGLKEPVLHQVSVNFGGVAVSGRDESE